MSDDSSGGKTKLVVGGTVTAVITLAVTFLTPILKKGGEDLAGVSSSSAKQPAVVVVQTPSAGGGASMATATTVPASAGGNSPTVVVVQTPSPSPAPAPENTSVTPGSTSEALAAPAAPREPKKISNDLSIPHYENTAEVQYFESSGTGSADDRDTAVMKALEEALSKQGSQLHADVRLKMLAETKKLNDTKVRRVEQSMASDFERVTGGLLRWWDIKTEEDDGRRYTIEVAAVVAKITAQAGKHSTRKTLAVLPFKVNSDVHMNDRVLQAGAIGAQLRETALSYLVNSRKFAVLDKTFTEELDRLTGERPSADPIQQAIDAAKKLGAEYVVIGLVDGLNVQSRKIGNLQVPAVDGLVSMRIIDLASRQTVLASSIQVATLPDLDIGGNRPENAIADALGKSMSERTMETIYPFKVAALNGDDEVMLNRGGDDLSVGQRFDLFNLGDEVKDPSNGESLGRVERKIGTVEVVRVEPKASYAKIIGKTKETVQVEAICRKPQTPKAEAKAKPVSAGSEIDNLFK